MSAAPFDLSIETLDAWCERLYGCNPLTENEVMQLCNKVLLARSLDRCCSYASRHAHTNRLH